MYRELLDRGIRAPRAAFAHMLHICNLRGDAAHAQHVWLVGKKSFICMQIDLSTPPPPSTSTSSTQA